MHITDHYVDDIQWFPCAVVSGVTWTEIPVSFRNFLCEYTDDFGVWRRYGAQVQCTATITVGAMRGGEAEYLKSLVDFGLKEPIRKIMDNKGYRTLLNTIAPGQIGQRKVAGTEVNMYWGDQRVSYISMWSRDYLEGMETIQSITVDQTASEEE